MQAFRAFCAARGPGSPLLSQTATTSLKTIQARMFCGSPVLNSSSVHVERSLPIPGASSSSSSQAPVPTRHELHFYSPIIASQAATFQAAQSIFSANPRLDIRAGRKSKQSERSSPGCRIPNQKLLQPQGPKSETRPSSRTKVRAVR